MTNFFDVGSPYLSHPLLTTERSADEAQRLARLLSLPPGGTVLDVGCGFGRHAVALAAMGHPTLGLDPSTVMITAARRAAEEANVPTATFEIGTGEDLTDVDTYDAAICMFTSLGQIGPDGTDNQSMVPAMARAVRPGGRLVVEVPVRDRAVGALVAEETLGAGQSRTEVARDFDKDTNRLSERFTVYQDGESTEFDLGYHLFSPEDLVRLLDASGFQTLAVRSSLEALSQPFGELIELAPDHGFMVALAAVR